MTQPPNQLRKVVTSVAPVAIAIAAAVLAIVFHEQYYHFSKDHYLLFHSLGEFTSIAIGASLFLVFWNARGFLRNNYLLVVGIAYLFVALLDLLHTLAYKGMGVFYATGSNLATQLWIAARYVESLSLFGATLVLGRRIRAGMLLLVYAAVTTLILLAIFAWNAFPVCYDDAAGRLTPFKVISEYIICGLLIAAGALLVRRRQHFDHTVTKWLLWAIATTVGSEILFTMYEDPYGLSNMIGHLLKLISFYMVYKALIETGLTKPYDVLFRSLRESQEATRRSEAKYRNLVEHAADMIFVHDLDGRILEANQCACDSTGYDHDELRRVNLAEIDLGFQHDGHQQELRRLTSGQASATFDTTFRRKDRSTFPAAVRIAAVSEESQLSLMAIARDVSAQYRMQSELVRRADQMATLVREAHHRIRNNLQSLIALLELERDHIGPDGVEALERCMSRIRAAAMVHRLLTTEAASDVPLLNLLKGLAELAKATYLGEQGLRVEIGVTGRNFDLSSKKATALAIAVNELMSNAILHAFEGRSLGRINIEVESPEGGQVLIRVIDNGTGRPNDDREGTGLALIRQLVEHDLSGRFELDSAAEGCQARIAFPLGG
ncbi:MAG: PAS domain S-box protein [Planctomycetes bacterium]|nr:PAS domain S-box protein [Planctomycetota bacterium]